MNSKLFIIILVFIIGFIIYNNQNICEGNTVYTDIFDRNIQHKNMWFSNNDIQISNIINIRNLHGYILPHAGTKYTGKIISETLQFKPSKFFDKVYIVYYPSGKKENINNKYYHEYYVPFMSLKYVIHKYWNIKHKIKFIKIDLRNDKKINELVLENALVILSIDFSHHLNLITALKLEDKAAHSLMSRNLEDNQYNKIIDDKISLEYLYNYINNNYQFQWVGRTRSPGLKGVGYLSFLLRKTNNTKKIDGYYVTVYDKNMNSRECLGKYDNHKRNLSKFIEEVIHKAKTTSRLTGGEHLNIPLITYSITYLHEEKHKNFKRGYHAIQMKNGALYLPDVFLENTYDNGTWINKNKDTKWEYGDFNLQPTLNHLNRKGNTNISDYILYATTVVYYDIKKGI